MTTTATETGMATDATATATARVRFVEVDLPGDREPADAIITVERRGGNNGQRLGRYYEAAPGSATAGLDFSSVVGTLHWAHADNGLRTFAVRSSTTTWPRRPKTSSSRSGIRSVAW